MLYDMAVSSEASETVYLIPPTYVIFAGTPCFAQHRGRVVRNSSLSPPRYGVLSETIWLVPPTWAMILVLLSFPTC